MTYADARCLNRAQMLEGVRRALRRSCRTYALQQQQTWQEDNWYHEALAMVEGRFDAILRIARRARCNRQSASDRLVDLVFAESGPKSTATSSAHRELDCCALYSILAPVIGALSLVLHDAPEALHLPTQPHAAAQAILN
jgi:hypothetical protein